MTSRRAAEVEYPVSDGAPVGETDKHVVALVSYSVEVLRDHFAGQQVYVSGNNFLYYVHGDPRAVVSPDTYVVKGASPELRDTFKVWEEGGLRPSFVLEITSRSTRQADLGEKKRRYEQDLEVREYFLYDPWGDWIAGQLRGFRLVEGAYLELEPDGRGRILSEELELELGIGAGGFVRYYRPGQAVPLLTGREQAAQERERAEQERERAEQERERAEQERERAEQERERAEQERQRADTAEREVERLRRLLGEEG